MNEFRMKEERLEKQYQFSSKEIKMLREKSDRLEKINKDLNKDTENWLQAKTSLQVPCHIHTNILYINVSSKPAVEHIN